MAGHCRRFRAGYPCPSGRAAPGEAALPLLAPAQPRRGELLTPEQCVDIMSTHENHRANTSQGILDAIPAGQAIIGAVADANESRNLGKYCRLAPDVP